MKYIIVLMVSLLTLGVQAQSGGWDEFRAKSFSVRNDNNKTIESQNEAELALFSYAVNMGEVGDYSVSLARDLDMSAHWFTPIGDSDARAFKGTFDGNEHQITIKIDDKKPFAALFRRIANAAIQHVSLTGSVRGGIHSAGLVGQTMTGENKITDCLVSVSVTCSDNGSYAPHGGGIIGHAQEAKNIVTGCLFNGSITAAESKVEGDRRAGAIIGWSNKPLNQYLYDCAELGTYNGFNCCDIMPVYLMGGSQQQPHLSRVSYSHHWMYQGRPMRHVKCDEPYYAIKKATFGTVYKTSKLEVSDECLRVAGAELYSYDDCTFQYEVVCLLQDHQMSHITANYYANDGKTVKMGRGSDCIIRAMVFNPNTKLKGSGTEDDPYQIHNDREWNYICYQLEQGNNFKDKYFRLEADLTLRYMAGTETTPFSGHFDGNGDNRMLEVKFANVEGDDTGLFRYAKDAEFKYFNIQGNIYATRTCIGGLIGRASGKILVRNCRVSAEFKAEFNGNANVGGLIGVTYKDNPDVTIRACRFDGSFDGINSSGWAGMLGWKNEGTVKVENCLFAPRGMHIKTTDCQNFARYMSDTDINSYMNYYLYRFQDSQQGRDATALSAGYMVEQLGVNDWEQLNGNGDPTPVLGSRGMPLEVKSSSDLKGLAKKKEKRAIDINFGEILHNDGHFNTICLPFNLIFMNIVIADGAELYQFASVKNEGNADKLVFSRTNTIQAGVPYLLRWTGQTSYTDRSHIWFTGVAITAEQGVEIQHGDYAFCGTFDEISKRKASDEGIYVMGGDDNWHPVKASTSDDRLLGAFRGFLRLSGGNGAPVIIGLEDEEGNTTAIIPVTAQTTADTTHAFSDKWYTLSGQQVDGIPTTKGLYIHQGKKVVVK